MNIFTAKNFYFIGIGGIGMSALATLLIKQGKKVSGSDLCPSEITDAMKKLGVKIHLDQTEENITKDIDILIYSSAVPENNPERKKAKKLVIPQWSYFEAVEKYMERSEMRICVAGTNGKTTTTSLAGLIAEKAGLDPTVIVGSLVKEWKSNARMGESNMMIVEACEHQEHFLHLDPNVIVLTNIEEDHLDYYKNLENIIKAFEKFVQKVPKVGWIIANNDDDIVKKLPKPKCQMITYGIDNEADVMAKGIVSYHRQQSFEVWFQNNYIDDVALRVPGKFNIYNALAAMSFALSIGVDFASVKDVLENYTGTWRRFEKKGIWKGAEIISDYAHHPTAVKGTLQAARDFFPGKRIIAVFQPHHKHRTKSLFNEFVEALREADVVILPEIYHVAGREEKDLKISSKDLVEALKKEGRDAVFTKDLKETKKVMSATLARGDVVLMMGAGDIYTLANQLCPK